MKRGEGCQESFNIGLDSANEWWEKRTKDCPICHPIRGRSQGRYRQVKKTVSVASRPNQSNYLKLHNGDIYHVDSNTILDRQALLEIIS